jgi:hypothetical protein
LERGVGRWKLEVGGWKLMSDISSKIFFNHGVHGVTLLNSNISVLLSGTPWFNSSRAGSAESSDSELSPKKKKILSLSLQLLKNDGIPNNFFLLLIKTGLPKKSVFI